MDRAVEVVGLAVAIGALAISFLAYYSLIADSDPSRWYRFGRAFVEGFATEGLAYGFPLLVAVAIRSVGPLNAYLVNLPVMLLLALLLYRFARVHARLDGPDPERWSAAGGAIALALFVLLNVELLRPLLNPYRDPFAHVLLLGSCLLLVRAVAFRSETWGPVGAGICLGLASSTREASVLMLAPMLAFGVGAAWRDRDLPFVRMALAFALGFGVACIPLAVQNAFHSGNPLVPGQAARTFAETGSLTPGVRLTSLADTLPAVWSVLRDHYGAAVLALMGIGIAAALRQPRRVTLLLSLPAFSIYLLFYGSYSRPVSRYLFVLDLFALPIAAGGVAALLQLLTRPGARLRPIVGRVIAAAAFGLASWAAFTHPPESELYRLGDAAIVGRLAASFEPGSVLLSEHSLAVTLRTFSDAAVDVPTAELRMSALKNPEARRRVVEKVSAAETHYVWIRTHRARESYVRQLLASEFDLVRVRPEPGVEPRYGDFVVERVAPWSRHEGKGAAFAEESGPMVLSVNVGALSRVERSGASLLLGAEVLDEHPRDHWNAYVVDAEGGTEIEVRLTSDAPVPARPAVELHPLDAPVSLIFVEQAVLDHYDRFSPSFFADPNLPYPAIAERGSLDVPTPGTHGAAFVIEAAIFANDRREVRPHRAEVRVRDEVVLDVDIPGDRPWRKGGNPYRISFGVPGELLTEGTTRIDWSVTGGERGPVLGIEWLRIYRHDLSRPLDIALAERAANAFILQGFHPLERGPDDGPSGRWTEAVAGLRLFRPIERGPLRLTVTYLVGDRPASIGLPRPRFVLNGRTLGGTTSVEQLGSRRRVTRHFDVSPAELLARRNVLRIETKPWVREGRARGILLERVRLAARSDGREPR